MSQGWIIFCTMKTIGSYVILVQIFYQILLQFSSFSHKIHISINKQIITINLIVLFWPSVDHSLNWYFELIKSPLILNSKRRPHQNVLKKYRKWFYQQNIKIRKFCPTNNQLLEKIEEYTRPMTKWYPEVNKYLLSNFICYLAPKKHRKKTVFDTGSFNIFPIIVLHIVQHQMKLISPQVLICI